MSSVPVEKHGTTATEDDDRKPAAVEAGRSNEEPSNLRQMRTSYADAFLDRCIALDPSNFDLPHGTYVCPWMPESPTEEARVQRNYAECRICGEKFTQHSREAYRHESTCYIQMLRDTTAKIGALLNPDLPHDERTRIADEYEKLAGLDRSFKEDRENRWKVIQGPLPNNASENTMEYWAPRCDMGTLQIFTEEVSNRPSQRCSLDVQERHGHKKLDFGSHCFQASLLPSVPDVFPGYRACAVQTTWSPLDDILNPCWHNGPNSRYRLGTMYTKEAAWSYNQRQTWRDGKVFRPFTPVYSVPVGGVNGRLNSEFKARATNFQQHGGPEADVWSTEVADLVQSIKPTLEKVAAVTNDLPIPRYQMIVDPNQFVRKRKSDGKRVWVPCEFDVAPSGSCAVLVGGNRAHWMDPGLIDSVATPVLNAALPMLAKLTKPHLLIEGTRLQVVVKAQSITVPKKQDKDDSPEYIGLWHVDGEHEPVVAVVLYYYDADEALVGGNMEFLDRRPIAVLGSGDTEQPPDFPPGQLKEALRPRQSEEGASPKIPNCSVPIQAGTMLVFSNYQMAHRVLRMVNTSENRAASRKFVALFVMDPAAERLVPARSHLAESHLYSRALAGKCCALPDDAHRDGLPQTAVTLIMEYLNIVPSLKQRRSTRNAMLRSQLIPKQSLGDSQSMVCTTGNGCVTMIGWVDSMLKEGELENYETDPYLRDDSFDKPSTRINGRCFPTWNTCALLYDD